MDYPAQAKVPNSPVQTLLTFLLIYEKLALGKEYVSLIVQSLGVKNRPYCSLLAGMVQFHMMYNNVVPFHSYQIGWDPVMGRY